MMTGDGDWRDMRHYQLRQDIKHWRFMSISYIVVVLLNLTCILLHCFKIAAAVAAGAFAWIMIVSPILWFICCVGYIFLSIAASKQWYNFHKQLKEFQNV